MSLRTLVRTILTTDLPVGTDTRPAIPAEKWFGSGSIQGIPEPFFAEIKLGGNYPGMGGVRRRRLEVWIHGPEGDYDPIEKWLQYVYVRLDGLEHRTGDGSEIVLCTWINDSTDLYDDGYRTNCMMSAFDIIGKETT